MNSKKENIITKYYAGSRTKFGLVISLAGFLFIVALAIAFQHYYIIDVNTSPRYSLSWHVPFNIFYFLIWIAFLPVIQAIYENFQSNNSRMLKRTLYYVVLPLGLVIVHQLIAAVVINVVLDYMELPQLIFQRILRNPWIWEDFVIYFLILAVINLENYQSETEKHKLRVSLLQQQLTQTKLRALKSQLHPHFLFNTLNTLSTLILKKDNREAERMLDLLEKFLSTTLNENEKSFVGLSDELKFIRRYLEIEKVRFKDKLSVIEEIDEATLNSKVPIFLLQPIVENSIHHAIAVKTSDGIIKITSLKENGMLSLTVEDNGAEFAYARKKSKEGVGLKITKERLVQHYGTKQNLSITVSQLGGYKVTIEIPFEKDPDSNEQ